jgi:hypothetical protein
MSGIPCFGACSEGHFIGHLVILDQIGRIWLRLGVRHREERTAPNSLLSLSHSHDRSDDRLGNGICCPSL